jgi:drug/metabolite transporter (DMT)-like permease
VIHPEMPSRRSAPLLVICLGIAAVSTASLMIRYAQGWGMPSLVIAAARLTLATAAIAPVVLVRDRSELLRLRPREVGLALASGTFLAVHFATWVTSLQFTSVASSVVLVSTSPLWVSLVSSVLLHERPRPGSIAGMVMALLGSAGVALADACFSSGQWVCGRAAAAVPSGSILGDCLALVGAFMAAGYFLLGRRLRPTLSLRVYVFLSYGMAALLLLLCLPVAQLKLAGYPPPAYLWIILLALVPQLVGHSSFNWALRYLSAIFVTISALGEPIGSTLLAYLFLGEIPGPVKLAGAALILCGILIASRAEWGRLRSAEATLVHEARP